VKGARLDAREDVLLLEMAEAGGMSGGEPDVFIHMENRDAAPIDRLGEEGGEELGLGGGAGQDHPRGAGGGEGALDGGGGFEAGGGAHGGAIGEGGDVELVNLPFGHEAGMGRLEAGGWRLEAAGSRARGDGRLGGFWEGLRTTRKMGICYGSFRAVWLNHRGTVRLSRNQTFRGDRRLFMERRGAVAQRGRAATKLRSPAEAQRHGATEPQPNRSQTGH